MYRAAEPARGAEPDNARHVQRARPEAALVSAAIDLRRQRDLRLAPPHEERANTFRAIDLVRAERGQIDAVAFDIDEYLGSARLTVTHTELSPEMMQAISGGWPAILSSLKSLLETGASLPMTRRQWKKAG